MKDFDAEAYKLSTQVQWDTVAEHWNAWGSLLDRWLGPSTEALLDMCDVQTGSRVLHVAGGSGQDAMQSARRVGNTGHVLSTDFSEELTRLANIQFADAGVSQAHAVTMDGENISVDGPLFDAVISRVGLIFFPDQERSMNSQIDALKSGGTVGALVYATPQECRFFSDPVGIIRKHANLPPPEPGMPGPFSLGAPGVIESLFERTGLTDIQIQKIDAPVTLPSAKDCLRFEQESFGALHQMLGGLDDVAKQKAWEAVEKALEAFETDQGFAGPCTMIAASGRKP
ncbi:ubiE/COQ5 methyltransferase family protein [Aliiroseovarius sediminilitoris]|uniref:UbiE/COQ5 methyltransferase family protein n=1 Tax=Aliiroseovarius sediminilitoris TaxID=1173584 RepID=A0A1I0NVF5_9RHOB|nr:class I SAM-dependent methyltransferase [Aliiroseovarius sediminilitoris]SEW04951.1 ubiE/COQ5 methyltransferase family protein [Aliiroseovarius sediminilitoris]